MKNEPVISTHGGYHTPVLLPEALGYLALDRGGTFVDATLGGGGYSEAMLNSNATLRVFGFDTDPNAMTFATSRLEGFAERFVLVKENFSRLRESLQKHQVQSIAGIVYDLGVSSHQLDTASIGLSYRVDAPLDMRLDPRLPVSAMDIVNEFGADDLKRIFRLYGEESYAGPIARKIVEARTTRRIETTTGLAAVITEGLREDKRNATLSRIFQALRIEVNGELESLRRSLEQAIDLLEPGGRIVVVSYHSLEDRIVKDLFREESSPVAPEGSLQSLHSTIDRERVRITLLTRKPVTPSQEEIERNARARSAKLRAAERT